MKMDIFSATMIGKEELFRSPRMKTLHYVSVLFPNGETDYFDGSDLTPYRDDALEYTDIEEAELDCAILEARSFNASVETFQRYFQ